jgi:hypothetical protein
MKTNHRLQHCGYLLYAKACLTPFFLDFWEDSAPLLPHPLDWGYSFIHTAVKERVKQREVFISAPYTQIYIVSIFMAYSRSATMDGPDPSVVIFNTSLFWVASPLHLT